MISLQTTCNVYHLYTCRLSTYYVCHVYSNLHVLGNNCFFLTERPLSIWIGRRSIALLSNTDVIIITIIVIITTVNDPSVMTERNSFKFIKDFKHKSVILQQWIQFSKEFTTFEAIKVYVSSHQLQWMMWKTSGLIC
jgi:hypothetical protein